jgi:hypothetical protein
MKEIVFVIRLNRTPQCFIPDAVVIAIANQEASGEVTNVPWQETAHFRPDMIEPFFLSSVREFRMASYCSFGLPWRSQA